MEKNILNEFETYLKELVEMYPKADTTVLQNPSSINEVGDKSKDYFFLR